MKDNFGRMTSSEASKKLQDFCSPRKCTRCLQDIEPNAPEGATICGSCADELRAEQDALEGAAITEAEAEDRARAEFEANKEAYEEEERARHFDDGGGYRYA